MFPWKLIVLSGAEGFGKRTCLATVQRIRPDVRFGVIPCYTTSPAKADEPWLKSIDSDTFREMKLAGRFEWIDFDLGRRHFFGAMTGDIIACISEHECAVTTVIMPQGILNRIANAVRPLNVERHEICYLHIRFPGESALRSRLEAEVDDLETVGRLIRQSKYCDEQAAWEEKFAHVPITYMENNGSKEEFEFRLMELFGKGQ